MRTFKLHTQKPISKPMKQNHTSGPWNAHLDICPNDSNRNDIRIVQPNTETETLPPCTIAILNQNMGEEAIANAHLIASAPELLSALECIAQEYDALMRSQGASADIGGSASPFTAGAWAGSRLASPIGKANELIARLKGGAK